MKSNHTQTGFEGDLFSDLVEAPTPQPEVRPYDKIIESRKNTTFAAEKLENQEEVQVVGKEEKPKIEYHIYPLDEVKTAAKEYFHGDSLAGDVWANKYALKDSDGNIYELTPDDMHHRIAREIARIAEGFSLHRTAGQPYGGHRQRLPNLLIVKLFRHRQPRQLRLLRRHYEDRPRAGATDETARRRGSRPVAHPPDGKSCEKLRLDFNRCGALHGTLLQLDEGGGARRTARCPDDEH